MPHRASLIFTLLVSLTLNTSLPRTPARVAAPTADKTAPAKVRGRPCPTYPAGARDGRPDSPEALATLGRRTQTSPFLPLHDPATGVNINLVSTATGRLSFTVTDLSIDGPAPLVFQRTYASDRPHDGGLGRGWAFVFDDYIRVEGDMATLFTASALALNFRREGNRFRREPEGAGRHQRFELAGADLIVEHDGELTRQYRNVGGAFRLSRISLPGGEEINITRGAAGLVTGISSGSGALTLRWSGNARPRLLRVSDHTGRRVSFHQQGGGLEAVTDAAGARWSYDYAGEHLTRAVDPAGRVLLRASYDVAGRAAEAGDAYGLARFAYGAPADGVSPRTVVTDPLGAETTFEHAPWGGLAGATDDEGQSTRLEYNTARRLVRVLDASGAEQTFDYDAEHKLARRVVGGVSHVDESEAGGIYLVERDARGRAVKVTPAAGPAGSFEYDAAGRQSAFVIGAARHEMGFDAAGRLATKLMPDGTVYRFEYDPRGLLTRESDSHGRAVAYERDAAGAVVGIYGANGRWLRAARDAAGRVVKLTASDGKSRRFAYNARGALTGYLDARGRGRKLKYDRRGRLSNVEDAEGGSISYWHSRAGRPVAARRGADSLSTTGFVPAAYAHPAPAQGADCFFNDTLETSPYGSNPTLNPTICDDPFGDILGGSGGTNGTGYSGTYGGGALLGGTGETCDQCRSRHYRICQLDLRGCLMAGLGISLVAAAACAALLAPAGWAGAIIAGAICQTIAHELEYQRCVSQAEACTLRITDNCRDRCP